MFKIIKEPKTVILMDFKDQLKQLAERVLKTRDKVQTEEATKHSFVMPFIQTLGYDVFNPHEVIPEYVADLGIKQGEKVDYAILKDDTPIILIECKWHGANLDVHNSQLFRYFHVSKAKFGLLTNGIEYRFYTDLIEANKMDEKPFFIFNITDIKDAQIDELKKFHKTYYNHQTIINTASELKYTNEIKHLIHVLVNDPSTEFVRFIAKDIYTGLITQKVIEQFSPIVKKSFNQYLNDLINERLKSALQKEEEKQVVEETIQQPITRGVYIETTKEEYEAYHIVKSILRSKVKWNRIVMRDAQTYCSILLDDNNRKPICRLYFNSKKLIIAIMDTSKKEQRYELNAIDDIYNFSEQILTALSCYVPDGAKANVVGG